MKKKFYFPMDLFRIWVFVILGFGLLYSASYLVKATEWSAVHSSILGLTSIGFMLSYSVLQSLQKRIEDLEKKVGGKAS